MPGTRLSRRRTLAALAAAGLPPLQAQPAFPQRAITLVVPFGAGGIADLMARAVAEQMARQLGQPVVVDNRPGAGTAIGAEATAKSAPDGYTVMIGTVSSHAINPALNSKLAYDPIRDFTPVSLVASIPFALLAHPALPVKTVQELIAHARANPGKLNYSSAGAGTSNHLAGELLKSLAGVDLVHVPYKGSAPALSDLLAGQVQLMFDLVLTATPHVKSGAARAIATTGMRRSSVLPEVPTVAESGVAGYEVSAWFGIFGPAGLPGPVLSRLNTETVKAMQAPDLRERLARQGTEPLSSTPEQFAAHVRDEVAKWAKVVKSSGMKVE